MRTIDKIILLLIFVMFLVGTIQISTATTQTFSGTSQGYDISYPKYEVIKQNTNFKLQTHIYNISDGLIITNTSTECNIQLYDIDGTQLTKQKLSYETPEFYTTIIGGNFSTLGTHEYIIWCNSTGIGGFVSGSFDITYSGQSPDTSKAIIYSILLLLTIFLLVATVFLVKIIPEYKKDNEGHIIDIAWVRHLKIPLYFLIYMLFAAIMFLASNISIAFLNGNMFYSFFNMIWTIQMSILPVIIILMGLWLIAQIVQNKELKSTIQRSYDGSL